MSESLAKEANSLWGIGKTLLSFNSKYDPAKLGALLGAIRACAERCRREGWDEWATDLNNVATELAGSARKKNAD